MNKHFPTGKPETQLPLISTGGVLPALPEDYVKPHQRIVEHNEFYADIKTPGHKNLIRYFFQGEHQGTGVEIDEQTSQLQNGIYTLQEPSKGADVGELPRGADVCGQSEARSRSVKHAVGSCGETLQGVQLQVF